MGLLQELRDVADFADVELCSKAWLSEPWSYGTANYRQRLVGYVDMVTIWIVGSRGVGS